MTGPTSGNRRGPRAHDGDDPPVTGPEADRQVCHRDLDDRALMARHCAGDRDAFGEIFRRHRDRMWAVALRTTTDRELAADAVQDAFLSAFRRAHSYRGDSAVTTWLHRIVVNACLDRLRRLRPARELLEFDLADVRDRPGEVDLALAVSRAMATLPEAQRLALVLVDMHGFSVAETAAILDVAEGTVKSRCSRGRAAVAPLLRPLMSGEDGTIRPADASHTNGSAGSDPPSARASVTAPDGSRTRTGPASAPYRRTETGQEAP